MTSKPKTTPTKAAAKKAVGINKDAPKNRKGTDKPGLAASTVKSEDIPLTARQQRFVDEYLTDLNATQAAIRSGYSAKTAGVIASENLCKPNIAKAIQAARERTAAKLEVTRERVLAEYAKLAFLDPRQFYNADGSIKNVPDMDANTAASLVGFEVDEIRLDNDSPVIGATKKLKWSDKKAALDSINRMMGWNQDKLKLQGDEESPLQTVTRIVLVPPKQTAETNTRPIPKTVDE